MRELDDHFARGHPYEALTIVFSMLPVVTRNRSAVRCRCGASRRPGRPVPVEWCTRLPCAPCAVARVAS